MMIKNISIVQKEVKQIATDLKIKFNDKYT